MEPSNPLSEAPDGSQDGEENPYLSLGKSPGHLTSTLAKEETSVKAKGKAFLQKFQRESNQIPTMQ